MKFLTLLLICIGFIGCSLPEKESLIEGNSHLVYPKYSTLFYSRIFEDREELVVKNPWDTSKIYGTYIITDKKKRIITLSGAAIGFLSELNEIDCIKGVGLKKYVYNSALLADSITEVGESQQLNVELLLSLDISQLFVSGFERENKNLKILEIADIEVVYTLEWMEQHPLARAEWIKFYAKFFDKEEMADSLFLEIETKYLELANCLKIDRPSVMLGNNYKDVWYSPGGGSFMAKLIDDAGADYYWKGDTSCGSLTLNIEDVLNKQINSSYWINPGQVKSLSELNETSPLLKEFDCMKSGEIYNYTKRMNFFGGNDFWESGVVKPHLLLKDYVNIFHPGLIKDSLYYYEKLP